MADLLLDRLGQLEDAVRRATAALDRLREENEGLRRELARMAAERKQTAAQISPSQVARSAAIKARTKSRDVVDAVREVRLVARHHEDDGSADLPVDGYDDLTAREAAKAVGQLEDPADVRAVLDHERDHADRKTVVERAEHRLD